MDGRHELISHSRDKVIPCLVNGSTYELTKQRETYTAQSRIGACKTAVSAPLRSTKILVYLALALLSRLAAKVSGRRILWIVMGVNVADLMLSDMSPSPLCSLSL